MASLTELRAFHLVAEAGSFSQAAREGAVTQSTLSTQVRSLEKSAGVMLFERRARGVQLTIEGAALHGLTCRMFDVEREVRHLLSEGSGISSGLLRITADGAQLPTRILSQLRRTEPGLRFSLDVANSTRVADMLLECRSDIGISACPPADSSLMVWPFARTRLVALLPIAHPMAYRKTLQLADLANTPMILRERGSQTRALYEANLAAAGLPMGDVTEVTRQDAVREMIATGLGMGVSVAFEAGHDKRIKALPIEDAELPLTEYMICLNERRRNPLIRTFLRAAEAVDWSEGGLGENVII